jgi:hypothetical protein
MACHCHCFCFVMSIWRWWIEGGRLISIVIVR